MRLPLTQHLLRTSSSAILNSSSGSTVNSTSSAALSSFGKPRRMFHIRLRFPQDSGLTSDALLTAGWRMPLSAIKFSAECDKAQDLGLASPGLCMGPEFVVRPMHSWKPKKQKTLFLLETILRILYSRWPGGGRKSLIKKALLEHNFFSRRRRMAKMQGRREEVTGGVYGDIRRGLPTTENAARRYYMGSQSPSWAGLRDRLAIIVRRINHY